jgi:hypothetical protein
MLRFFATSDDACDPRMESVVKALKMLFVVSNGKFEAAAAE